jgi:hypothetical protein
MPIPITSPFDTVDMSICSSVSSMTWGSPKAVGVAAANT